MIRGNKLYINITNHCDVCCPFCCMKSDSKKQSFMNFDTIHKIMKVEDYTDISVSAYYCDSNNKRNANRKPNIGMIKEYMDFIEYMNNDEDEEEKIVYDTILMIGDASGKEGQFSDSDKKTAENFGCEYMDVDDFVDKYKG